MTPAQREEATRVAVALTGCMLDRDTEGAAVLLDGCSRQVLAQAAADLARWFAELADVDRDELRAGIRRCLLACAVDGAVAAPGATNKPRGT